eukprot:TRINITY_DN5302_c0_g1_i1.p1 TRINITY_DN5302_c0_g1~~TRINITY_DN5302_c0_g1_i1.p1  ORF type:complete len:553 (-),score=177.18 TRINITY_DN5302_c0_g1_i1:292-1950(-)
MTSIQSTSSVSTTATTATASLSLLMNSVEVFSLETSSYHLAEILDVKDGQVAIHYENGWKADEYVLPSRLRRCPPKHDPSTFNPQVGEKVEVQAQAKENEPWSWWPAQVKTARGSFFLINYINCGEDSNEILEKEHIRPFNTNSALTTGDLLRREIVVPSSLRNSIRLEDFAHMRNSCTILALFVNREKDKSSLVCIGSKEACDRAAMIARVTFKHLTEIQELQNRTQQHVADMNKIQQTLKDGHIEEFPFKKDLVGLMIGKKGQNITEAKAVQGVQSVRIDDHACVCRIVANTKEAALEARSKLEFCEEVYKIPSKMVGIIVGLKFKYLREIENESKCNRITLLRRESKEESETTDESESKRSPGWIDPNTYTDDEGNAALVIRGTKSSVTAAKLLLDTHVHFTTQKQQLATEERKSFHDLNELQMDYGVRGGRGARGGRGRGGRGRGARTRSTTSDDKEQKESKITNTRTRTNRKKNTSSPSSSSSSSSTSDTKVMASPSTTETTTPIEDNKKSDIPTVNATTVNTDDSSSGDEQRAPRERKFKGKKNSD